MAFFYAVAEQYCNGKTDSDASRTQSLSDAIRFAKQMVKYGGWETAVIIRCKAADGCDDMSEWFSREQILKVR